MCVYVCVLWASNESVDNEVLISLLVVKLFENQFDYMYILTE